MIGLFSSLSQSNLEDPTPYIVSLSEFEQKQFSIYLQSLFILIQSSSYDLYPLLELVVQSAEIKDDWMRMDPKELSIFYLQATLICSIGVLDCLKFVLCLAN